MNEITKSKNGITYKLISLDDFSPDMKVYNIKWKFFLVNILTNKKIYTVKFEIDEISDILVSLLSIPEKSLYFSEKLSFNSLEEAEELIIKIFLKFKNYINSEQI
jgi:hypothetical protein